MKYPNIDNVVFAKASSTLEFQTSMISDRLTSLNCGLISTLLPDASSPLASMLFKIETKNNKAHSYMPFKAKEHHMVIPTIS
jgi:hypothetical protein